MGDGGRGVDCDAKGTETSVSHELCGAALAFTGCVIFLQAFHNVNSELFFAKIWVGGVEAHRMHKHLEALVKALSSSVQQQLKGGP